MEDPCSPWLVMAVVKILEGEGKGREILSFVDNIVKNKSS
jgi:hypothetical protein